MTQTPHRIEDQVRAVLGDKPRSYARIEVPEERLFLQQDVDHIASGGLADLARQLIADFPGDLGHLRDAEGRFFWKAAGGKRGGKALLGKTSRATGLARDLMGAPDYVVILSADHARDFEEPERQIPALLFHELSHVVEAIDRFGNPTDGYQLRGHDVEMFFSEIGRFGPWKSDLALAQRVFAQLPLPEMA